MSGAGLRFVASAIGAGIAEVVTLPLDVAKVRLQVQKTAGGEVKYRGMIDCVVKVGRVEGVRSLWKGFAPALIRQVSYHSFTFVLYEPVKVLTSGLSQDGATPSYIHRLVAAGLSAAVAISLFNPTEVLKTQMQSTSGTSSMREVASRIWAKDGWRGFWAGLRPNVTRTFLVNGAEIGTYDEVKGELLVFVSDGMVAHVGASGLAGLVSACVSTPTDVVKTRLMNAAGSDQAPRGILQTFASIIREEGFLALYKGFLIIFCRKVIWCVVFFVIYESLHTQLKAAVAED